MLDVQFCVEPYLFVHLIMQGRFRQISLLECRACPREQRSGLSSTPAVAPPFFSAKWFRIAPGSSLTA